MQLNLYINHDVIYDDANDDYVDVDDDDATEGGTMFGIFRKVNFIYAVRAARMHDKM